MTFWKDEAAGVLMSLEVAFLCSGPRALFPECDGVVQNSTTALCMQHKAVVFGWAELFVVFLFYENNKVFACAPELLWVIDSQDILSAGILCERIAC